MTIDKIRVIGAGAMGRGIAQIAVAAGYSVELTDASDDAVTAALEFVTRMLRRSAEKGQRSPQDAEAAIARLTRGTATAPADDIDLVIEAVVEQLEVKRAIFTQVERAVPNAILASNTSSLSITAIAAGLQDPSRLLGLHFFNPVPLMRLVEVIPGVRTSPELITAATRFVATLGHTAVHAKDTPGFLVNHLGRALPTESLALLSEGVASVADIDRIARDTVGLRMGPFELMDLTGLDVSHPVMEIVWSGFYADPRLRPSVESAGGSPVGCWVARPARASIAIAMMRRTCRPSPALPPTPTLLRCSCTTTTHSRNCCAPAASTSSTLLPKRRWRWFSRSASRPTVPRSPRASIRPAPLASTR
jgi:3-hydroxybutyryl-CoA dehydrogenase